MPKNNANYKAIERRVNSFVAAQRGNPNLYRILAEGDSWFSTPVEGWKRPNLIDALHFERRGRRRYNVVSVANPAADLLDILDPDNVDLKFATISNWLHGQRYDLLLLSCGGNDVLRTELARFLVDGKLDDTKQCLSRARGLEEQARCFLDCAYFCNLLNVLRDHFLNFRRDVLAPLDMENTPVLAHGYDYAVPSGRSTTVAGLITVGPWLRPKFIEKNIPPEFHPALVKLMIDEFNRMLRRVATSQPDFYYLDLRGLLLPSDWADEIHVNTSSGIPKVRDRFVQAIDSIRNGQASSVISAGTVGNEYSCPCP